MPIFLFVIVVEIIIVIIVVVRVVVLDTVVIAAVVGFAFFVLEVVDIYRGAIAGAVRHVVIIIKIAIFDAEFFNFVDGVTMITHGYIITYLV